MEMQEGRRKESNDKRRRGIGQSVGWGAREKKRKRQKDRKKRQKGTRPNETGPWFDNSTAAEQKEEEIDAGEMPIARDN